MIPLRKKLSLIRRSLSAVRRPRFASLFVTRECNFHCPYCRSRDQRFKDMDTASWKAVIDRLHSFGVRHFTITGGEPMLRPDIVEIVSHLSGKKNAISVLISNFRPLTVKALDGLADAGLDFLTCSLDTLYGPGEKSGRTFLSMLEYARTRSVIPSVLAVITRDNLADIPALLAEVTRRGILFDMALYQNVGGLFSPSDDALKVKDRAALEGLFALLRRAKRETGLVAPGMGYLSADLGQYERMAWKCPEAEDSYLVVNNDGRLMPCQEYLTDVNVLSLNSLSDPAWRLAKQEKVRACRGCYYGCYYQKEHVSPSDAFHGLVTLLRA